MKRDVIINKMEDVKMSKSDFVFEHHGKSFSDVYKADKHILGEGKPIIYE